jgi:hypothetical protein
MDKKIVITKMDGPLHREKTPKKSILKKTSKIKPVADPAKSPPVKSMRRHTIRMLTSKGMRRHRKTTKHRISKMKPAEITRIFSEQTDIKLKPETPSHITKKLLDNAVSAGFVSLP